VRRREKGSEEWIEKECRTAIQEKNNMRKILLHRMTRSSKETYREHRRRPNKICQDKKREMLKRQIESIEVDREKLTQRNIIKL
jgi:hypothetical protein